MKIATTDGSIAFAKGDIRPEQDRESFLASAIGRDAAARLVEGEWCHLSIRPEPGISGTALFKGARLHQVSLAMELPSDASGEWTWEREQERKAVHDGWLRSELGEPPLRYAWGEVSSDFDPKAVASEIIVSYAG